VLEATGRGVRVAMIDSGVNPTHPHVGGVVGGVALSGGGDNTVYLDYLGHGTAVAAAIREKAPEAELFAVKVFDRTLSTSLEMLVRALEWCVERGVHVVNLSLGTARPEDLRPALEHAAAAGVVVVSPPSTGGAVPVDLDWSCPRDAYRYQHGVFLASGYPRPIPGVPPADNLNGASFAVANMTGFVACARELCPGGLLTDLLIRHASPTRVA